MSIGIVGFGFVGQALYASLKNPTHCVIYDPPKGFDDFSRIRTDCNIVFCCLPSPMKEDGSQDFSYFKNFFEKMEGYRGIIVVKSTVLWSDIEEYFREFDIVMNPEFLNQNSSHEDFKNQKIVILGGRTDLCLTVKVCYGQCFYLANPAIEYFLCTADEAIHIKYTHNIYHAYKVLFWNYVHETFENHRKLFNAYSKITGNTFEMSNICADGKPGYGGACFPKDVAAANSEKPHELTKFMIKYNKRLRGED